MRFLVKTLCKCCIIIEENPKGSAESKNTQENNLNFMQSEENSSKSPFRIRETRQRSVDYIVRSPRFGGQIISSTGGTENFQNTEIN
jgi:hypothetical protein